MRLDPKQNFNVKSEESTEKESIVSLNDAKITVPLRKSKSCKKRNRRPSHLVQKAFVCPIDGCRKGYGYILTQFAKVLRCIASLRQHIKIKHMTEPQTLI